MRFLHNTEALRVMPLLPFKLAAAWQVLFFGLCECFFVKCLIYSEIYFAADCKFSTFVFGYSKSEMPL